MVDKPDKKEETSNIWLALLRNLGEVIDILRAYPYLEFVMGIGIITILIILAANDNLQKSTYNVIVVGFFGLAALALILDSLTSFTGRKVGRVNMEERTKKRILLNEWLENLLQEEFEAVRTELAGNKPEKPTRAAFLLYMDQEKRLDELEIHLESRYNPRKPNDNS